MSALGHLTHNHFCLFQDRKLLGKQIYLFLIAMVSGVMGPICFALLLYNVFFWTQCCTRKQIRYELSLNQKMYSERFSILNKCVCFRIILLILQCSKEVFKPFRPIHGFLGLNTRFYYLFQCKFVWQLFKPVSPKQL